jgi:L-histidine Nalpha-methyltransferase
MNFADDVRRGLSASQKWLDAKYLYDALGSALFEAICELPEYYLTRAETEILSARAREVVEALGSPMEIIELGSGSATKTRYVIEAALLHQQQLRYRPVDISASALASSAHALHGAFPGLVVDGVNADYLAGLARISRNGSRRTLALFLGSNVGNFDPPGATTTLTAVRKVLEPGDGLLLGADLRKDRAVLEAAYNDALGVTAAFNRNLLTRINRELGGTFALDNFGHEARYDEALGRIEMHLVSQSRHAVRVNAIDLDLHFDKGETIFTESSYKFDDASVQRLAQESGFGFSRRWTDAAGRFADFLLIAR